MVESARMKPAVMDLFLVSFAGSEIVVRGNNDWVDIYRSR
jgi:hypothetical protein